MLVDSLVGRTDLSQLEVVRPSGHHPVQFRRLTTVSESTSPYLRCVNSLILRHRPVLQAIVSPLAPRCSAPSRRPLRLPPRYDGLPARQRPRRLLAKPCRSVNRIESLETPSLSHVAPSGVSERSGAIRLPPVSKSLPPCCAPLELRPLPPPALPGICGTPSLSVTPSAQPDPRGFPVGVCAPPTGLPVLLLSPSSRMPPPIPRRNRSVPASLASRPLSAFPLINGGSASALPVSRPARRLLTLAYVLAKSPRGDPSSSECLSPIRYLLAPRRLLPAGATVAGRDSHPLGYSAFPRRTSISDMRMAFSTPFHWSLKYRLAASGIRRTCKVY